MGRHPGRANELQTIAKASEVKTAFINVTEDRFSIHACFCGSLQREAWSLLLAAFAPTFTQPLARADDQDPLRLDCDFRSAFGFHSGLHLFLHRPIIGA